MLRKIHGVEEHNTNNDACKILLVVQIYCTIDNEKEFYGWVFFVILLQMVMQSLNI